VAAGEQLGHRISQEAGRIAGEWMSRIAGRPFVAQSASREVGEDCVRYLRGVAVYLESGDEALLREAAQALATRHARLGVSPAEAVAAYQCLQDLLWEELAALSDAGEVAVLARRLERALGLSIAEEVQAYERAVSSARALERAEVERLARHLQRDRATDELTGFYAARCGQRLLTREVKRALRHGHPLTVLVVAPDGLDALLHAGGTAAVDEVVKSVAEAIQESVRESDLVWRADDGVFVVALPETPDQGAVRVADRIQSAAHRSGTPAGDTLTVSVGIARLPEHGEDADTLVARAREACAHAQSLGTGLSIRWDEIPRS
jgi:diguanylate cyclase (GGDEF)-like protein